MNQYSIHIDTVFLEHKQELCNFVMEKFAEIINKNEQSHFVCPNFEVIEFNEKTYAFNYRWVNRNNDHVYTSTQCYLYPDEAILIIFGLGKKSYMNELLDYLIENLETFGKIVKRDKLIDECI